MTIKGNSISPSTWIPVSVAGSVIISAIIGTYQATTAWNNMAYESKELKNEVRAAVARIDGDLSARTRARWTASMEHASWTEFERLNPSLQIKTPDTHSIKARLEP